jgi:hypothetical protein
MLPPVFVELKANITEFTHAMGEARAEMTSVEAKGTSSFDKLAGFGKAALFGLGTAAVAVGGISVEMADKFEQSHAKLEQALKNAGSSFEQFKEPIDKAQKAMEAYGFTNTDTQEALGNLTTALKDPKKALDALNLAADLAKYKHIDLATAATAVARAQEGNLRALKQLGIDLPIAAGGAVKLEKANTDLAKAQAQYNLLLASTDKGHVVSKGSTEAVAKAQEHYNDVLAIFNTHATHTVAQQIALKNAAEKVQEAQAKLSDTHIVGGVSAAKLEAAHQKLIAAQEKVNSVSSAGTDIMKGLSDAIGGQAAAQAETFSGKMQALKATSEDVAKNIGMALIPILEKLMVATKGVIDFFREHKVIAEAVAVVIGTVLVAAIGAYMVKLAQSAIESVINFGKMIAGWIATGAAATEAGIASAIASGGMTIAIGAIVVAIAFLATHWKEAWAGIKAITEGVWHFIEGIMQSIKNSISSVIGAVKSEINGIIGLVNSAIKALDSIKIHIPGTNINLGVDIPQIPKLAEGGIVTSPTLAMIGESGSEAVIPLSKMGGMGSGMNITIQVQGSVISEGQLINKVRDGLAQTMRRKGVPTSVLGI